MKRGRIERIEKAMAARQETPNNLVCVYRETPDGPVDMAGEPIGTERLEAAGKVLQLVFVSPRSNEDGL